MSETINYEAKVDFWIKHNQNVLFIGHKGVGKTEIVTQAFNRHNLKWKYYSASTMDPWVDFCGVPQETRKNPLPKDFEIVRGFLRIDRQIAQEYVLKNWSLSPENTTKALDNIENWDEGPQFLNMIRPLELATNDIEAFFFDEYNRSPKKVRNAVMELIQKKSINGVAFPKLRFVWAAINPRDDSGSYDVDEIDLAQKDRFQVKINIAYKPNTTYFSQKYGNTISEPAIQFWNELTNDQKMLVSPRCLDYALNLFRLKGDIRDVLPDETNPNKLVQLLTHGPTSEKLEKFMRENDVVGAKKFLAVENNYASAIKLITDDAAANYKNNKKESALLNFFLKLLDSEKIIAQMAESDLIKRHVFKNADSIPVYATICHLILEANTNRQLVVSLTRAITEKPELQAAIDAAKKLMQNKPLHFNNDDNALWNFTLSSHNSNFSNIHEKFRAFAAINDCIPKNQTPHQAEMCLKILRNIFGDGSLDDAIHTDALKNLAGIFNNCTRFLSKSNEDVVFLLEHFKSLDLEYSIAPIPE